MHIARQHAGFPPVIAFAVATALGGGVHAQLGGEEGETPILPSSQGPGFTVTLDTNFEYMFDSDVDGGGEFSLTRFGSGLTFRQKMSPDSSLMVRAGYQLDSYDFSGNNTRFGGGGNPWEDIHTVSVAAIYSVNTSPDWTVYGGPVIRMAQEESFDLNSNSVIFGGLIGASHRISDSLTLGGGIGIASQIEDDARFFPSIIVNWKITDDLRLTNAGGGRTGLELVYDYNDDWEIAIGGAYERRRFRLDDDGFAPKGVVEDTSFPFWVRVGYMPSDSFKLNFFGGIVTNGELDVDDNDGHKISDADYDDQAMLGASLSIRF